MSKLYSFSLQYLEVYEDEHFYVDPLDNLKQKSGPISQFRRFQVILFVKVKLRNSQYCKIRNFSLPKKENNTLYLNLKG